MAGRQLLALPHRLQQAERREMVGDAWLDSGVVCDNDVGGPLDPDSMSTAFKRKLARLGLPQQYVAPTAQQTAGAVAALDSILGE